MNRQWRGVARAGVALPALPLLLHGTSSAAGTPAPSPAVTATPSHSRLVFAAGEEDSTLSGFTGGRVPPARDYWSVRRNLRAYTPSVWRELQEQKAWLTVNIRWRRDFGPVPADVPHFGELLPFLRTASRHHVGIIAWLTVPYADGYWATEQNIREYQRVVRDFSKWAKHVGFRPKEVLLDLEAPLADSAVSSNALHNPAPVVAMFDRNVEPAHQCAAIHEVGRVVGWLRAHGYRTIAATYPFFFDDITDGNIALSDGLNLPIAMPGVFREVAFMTMRSVYAGLTGSDAGPSILASYSDAMKQWYGRSATFSLGVAGEGPYENHLGRLVTDVRLAATLTTGTVGVYSLERALKAYGLRGVSKLFTAVKHPLAGTALARATALSPGTREARVLLGTENALVTAGLPLATASRGSPQLPNTWPPSC